MVDGEKGARRVARLWRTLELATREQAPAAWSPRSAGRAAVRPAPTAHPASATAADHHARSLAFSPSSSLHVLLLSRAFYLQCRSHHNFSIRLRD